LVRRLSEDDLSMWTQAVAEWDEPDNPFDLGPEFVVASTDFGASLDPTSAILMIRQLLQNKPNHRMNLAISDLIDGLPLVLSLPTWRTCQQAPAHTSTGSKSS